MTYIRMRSAIRRGNDLTVPSNSDMFRAQVVQFSSACMA